MSSSTVFQPLERTRYFEDNDGVLATSKHEDDEIQLVLDWTNYLGSDTISSVTYTDHGVTTSGKSNTTTATTATITKTGWTEIEVTMASGRTVTRQVRFYPIDGSETSDYAS